MSDQAYICRCGELRDHLAMAQDDRDRRQKANAMLYGQVMAVEAERDSLRAELEAIKAKLCWSCARGVSNTKGDL